MTSDPAALWETYETERSEQLRNRLVLHYAPLVKYVVGRLAGSLPSHVDTDDLLSEGTLGLVTAVERFDPAYGAPFASFAVPRIRGAVVDALRAWDWLPRHVRHEVQALDAATARLEEERGRWPDDSALAAELGTTAAEVARLRRLREEARQVPFDLPAVHDLPSPDDVEPDGGTEVLPSAMVRALHRLTQREQVLVALYYWERFTMAQVGEVLGVSESRVSQMHRSIRQRLAGSADGPRTAEPVA